MSDKDTVMENEIKKAVCKACEIENQIYEQEAYIENHVFSEEHNQKIKALFDGEKRANTVTFYGRKSKWKLLKGLLIAAIIMILAVGTVLAVEPIRNRFFQLIEQVYWDHTDISFRDIEKDMNSNVTVEGPFVRYKPDYVPEGYHLTDEEFLEEMNIYVCSYMDDEGNAIHYEQSYPEEFDASITSNGEKAELVSVSGNKAYYITASNSNTLLSIKGRYLYVVSGKLEYDAMSQWMKKILEDN